MNGVNAGQHRVKRRDARPTITKTRIARLSMLYSKDALDIAG